MPIDKNEVAAIENRITSLQNAIGGSFEEALKEVHVQHYIKQGTVPLSIFQNKKLGSLEAIVKYLKEEHCFTYSQIARILGRNAAPIGITYRAALRKHPSRLPVSHSQLLPLHILRGKLSVLESIAVYFKKQGFTFHEIAILLNRDDRTIWTVHRRAQKKGI